MSVTKEISIGISVLKIDSAQSKEWRKQGIKIGITFGTGKKDEKVLLCKTLEEAKTNIKLNIFFINNYLLKNDRITIIIMSESDREEARILEEYLVKKIALFSGVIRDEIVIDKKTGEKDTINNLMKKYPNSKKVEIYADSPKGIEVEFLPANKLK